MHLFTLSSWAASSAGAAMELWGWLWSGWLGWWLMLLIMITLMVIVIVSPLMVLDMVTLHLRWDRNSILSLLRRHPENNAKKKQLLSAKPLSGFHIFSSLILMLYRRWTSSQISFKTWFTQSRTNIEKKTNQPAKARWERAQRQGRHRACGIIVSYWIISNVQCLWWISNIQWRYVSENSRRKPACLAAMASLGEVSVLVGRARF